MKEYFYSALVAVAGEPSSVVGRISGLIEVPCGESGGGYVWNKALEDVKETYYSSSTAYSGPIAISLIALNRLD